MQGITKYVGKQIKKYRIQKGMTQKELGLRIGVKHNTISSYESGINDPGQDVLFSIAKTLGINVDDLFPSLFSDCEKENELLGVAESSYTYKPTDFMMVPIVGRISCGEGILAKENIEGYELTPKEWLNGSEHFYLRAKGDSMVGARIFEGDLLLIRKQPEVESGEIAAVLINDEDDAVLKRVFINGEKLTLQSENPEYNPISAPPAKAKIIGKLKMNVIKY